MKPFNKNKTTMAFWEGETTIPEEKLIKGQPGLDEIETLYFRYLETEQVVPAKLESMVWKSVKKNQRNTKQMLIRWAIAASFVLIIGTILFINKQKQQAHLEEQFALLEQALSHVSNEINTSPTDNVLYKDEYIIIVANN